MSASYKDRIDWTKQQINRLLPKGGKVVDIGCDVSVVARERTDTTFVDNRPYEELADNAKKLGYPMFPKEKFVQSDALKLPFQDGEFDVAVLTEMLEHVDDPVAVLKEAQRVGRRIVLSVPNEFEWDKVLAPFCNPVHVRHYTHSMLAEHLAAADLSAAIEKLAYDDGTGRIWVFWLAVAVKAGEEEIMLVEELPGAEPSTFDNPAYWCGELGYRPGPFGQGYFDFPNHELKVEYIMQKYQPKSVLDIGCAMGFIVKRFRDKGVDAWGIDISTYALDKSPVEVKPFLRRGSATSLPWHDKHFDFGVSFGTLEHLSSDEVTKAIGEIKRVCQRGLVAVGTSEDIHFDTDQTHRTKMPLEWWQKQFGEGWEVIQENAEIWIDLAMKSGLGWCVQKVADFAEKELHAVKLKIGIISGPLIPVPPKGYGGLERVVYDLAVALGEDGHDVTLFAPDESHAEQCKLVKFGPAIMDVKCDWMKAERESFQKVREQIVSDGFQIIHSNTWFGFAYQARIKNPALKVCHTHHGHLDPRWWKSSKPPFPLNLVSISKFMAAEYAQLGITAHPVYNGIDTNKYAFRKEKGDRLIFVGRASNFKQPHVAIEVAKKLGMGIDMVCGTFVDSDEYMRNLKASCDGTQVRWVEDPPQDEKVKLMQSARCLLFPSKMQEPFGLVAAESMACGTPVVALRDGAIAEVVEDGKTGYVCDSADEMCAAVKKIGSILPEDCRQRVQQHFSREVMATMYLREYRNMLAGQEW